jgi:hypothetical protein
MKLLQRCWQILRDIHSQDDITFGLPLLYLLSPLCRELVQMQRVLLLGFESLCITCSHTPPHIKCMWVRQVLLMLMGTYGSHCNVHTEQMSSTLDLLWELFSLWHSQDLSNFLMPHWSAGLLPPLPCFPHLLSPSWHRVLKSSFYLIQRTLTLLVCMSPTSYP